jgi:hypothetical protein
MLGFFNSYLGQSWVFIMIIFFVFYFSSEGLPSGVLPIGTTILLELDEFRTSLLFLFWAKIGLKIGKKEEKKLGAFPRGGGYRS